MFPSFLNDLVDRGITSYRVDLSLRSIVYYGRDSKNIEKERQRESLPGKAIATRGSFNKKLLKNAWIENDYDKFLAQIAQAGVRSYRVDTSARTITYFGDGASYTETVPETD